MEHSPVCPHSTFRRMLLATLLDFRVATPRVIGSVQFLLVDLRTKPDIQIKDGQIAQRGVMIL